MNQSVLTSIFQAGLNRVNPERMITDTVRLNGETLEVATETQQAHYNLRDFDRIVVTGAGKAGAKMALGLERVLGTRIHGGVVVVKYGHVEKLQHIELVEAGHPVPDLSGVEAARRVVQLAQQADERTLIISHISGGGSALMTLPFQDERHALTLQDVQTTTSLLLACGAPIQEINCVRKHISGITGGRFCRLLHPAASLNLILSDVVGDSLENIASGLTAPDPSTFGEAWAVLERYNLTHRLPEAVQALLLDGVAGAVPETPKAGDRSFERVNNILIGSNALALRAAERAAHEAGYRTICLGSQITGEAREVAKVFAGIAKDVRRQNFPAAAPLCVLAGGETTVTIRGDGGGGRNQEMALACVAEIGANPAAFEGVGFLSAATDGNDGPNDGAGGFAAVEVLRAAQAKGLQPREYLDRNDSYHFLDRAGYLFKTGPTNTNVCDLQVLLVD